MSELEIDWEFVEFVVDSQPKLSDRETWVAFGSNAGSVIDLCQTLVAQREEARRG